MGLPSLIVPLGRFPIDEVGYAARNGKKEVAGGGLNRVRQTAHDEKRGSRKEGEEGRGDGLATGQRRVALVPVVRYRCSFRKASDGRGNSVLARRRPRTSFPLTAAASLPAGSSPRPLTSTRASGGSSGTGTRPSSSAGRAASRPTPRGVWSGWTGPSGRTRPRCLKVRTSSFSSPVAARRWACWVVLVCLDVGGCGWWWGPGGPAAVG